MKARTPFAPDPATRKGMPMSLRDKAKAVVELPTQLNKMTMVIVAIGIISVIAFMMASVAMGRTHHAD